VDPFQLQRRGKLVVGALMIGILGLTLVLLQQQFSQADYRRAIELLGAKEPGARWSIGQELVARSKGGSPDCRAKIASSFRGTVEVTCSTGDNQLYRFEVDLVRKSVQPADAATRSLVQEAAEKQRADGGSPGNG
jgi:hypothetical protein